MQTNQDINRSSLPKIAIYYPYFLGGGAEAVALWMLEALKDNYDLTLFTFSDVDFNKLNLMYETHLSNELIKTQTVFPKSLNHFSNFLTSNNPHFRQFSLHSVLRLIKSKRDDYDLLISAYNAVDLGKPGLQYIHWIKVVEGEKLAQKYYNKLSDFSVERLKQNISLVNSQVVQEQVSLNYNIESTVVYPPVVIQTHDIPWEEKEDAFICSGRLVRAKQPHKAIQILKAVREKGFNVKLYLTGGGGGGQQDYIRFLNKMIKENSSWVKLCKNMSYEDYTKVLYNCKYGLHYKQEPFGISVAEMVKAGVIPFVKSSGGQIEIVGKDNQDLFYKSDEDAVNAIVKVLQNQDKIIQIRQSLKLQKDLFSTDNFMSQIKRIVQQNLNRI
ncbi:glycosyl transferase family 1 [Aphanothece hegewaldii CCALA 016]|uniref:Glycosyl transferase family 1 n=1 Tax=Aphanothece hegewaldii CCALA 016 TaxID=2107694 RepID=A0A2T1LTY0_9CHRO|nr:glycosyltransferase [Aphanothece hegewaldii]PSF34267.1 glycosyl transferase family 1 [Aphanothece hegewaldii CCALA 016]